MDKFQRLNQDPLIDGVVVLIEQAIENRESGVDRVAENLSMSTRTLVRKLASKGTTYKQLHDSVRLRRSTQLLRETDKTIAEISEILRYSDSAAFQRSFKRISGFSPTEYRSANLR